ncbi:MAG: CoA ester lyase [Clostridia bacterium]|nr:CoA ester lyase [Clostridia bacterium]
MRRSMLFLPGNNPNMLINAAVLGADAVIFDLEDAVSPAEKDAARILVRNTMRYMDLSGCERIVRINSVDTAFWQKDLLAILPEKPDLILLPKTGSAEDVLLAERFMDEAEESLGLEKGAVGLMPLIETALGVENAFAIASATPRVKALFLGAEDLTADLQCKRTKESREIEYARTRLVVAARAAGVDVYDTPFTDVNDDEGIELDALTAKGLGFTGKASISPRHVEVINRVFTPTLEEIDYAYEVMDAIEEAKRQGKGAIALYGKMIDAPIVARAERTIAMAKALGLERRA